MCILYVLTSKLNQRVFKIFLGTSSSYEQAVKDEMRWVGKYTLLLCGIMSFTERFRAANAYSFIG